LSHASVYGCAEAESRESPRERERKILGQEKRERQRKLKMRRGIKDDASCFKGFGHDFAPTAVAVVNQPATSLDLKMMAPHPSLRTPKQRLHGRRQLSNAVAAKLRLSLLTRPSQTLLRCYYLLRMRRRPNVEQ